MTYYLDGTTKAYTPQENLPFVSFELWRDEYETTKPGDELYSSELGKIKCAVFIHMRIPAILMIGYVKLRLRIRDGFRKATLNKA